MRMTTGWRGLVHPHAFALRQRHSEVGAVGIEVRFPLNGGMASFIIEFRPELPNLGSAMCGRYDNLIARDVYRGLFKVG